MRTNVGEGEQVWLRLPNQCLAVWLPTARYVTRAEFDSGGIGVLACPSLLASLFEKILAVTSIAANVTVNRANCLHPFSIDALPISVRPAKQNRRCTQKTCSEDCPNSTKGLIAAAFVIG